MYTNTSLRVERRCLTFQKPCIPTHTYVRCTQTHPCMCTSYTYMYTCTQIYTRQIDVVHMSNLPWMHTIPLSFLIWTTFFTSFATTTGTIGPLGKGKFSWSSDVGSAWEVDGAWATEFVRCMYIKHKQAHTCTH